MPHRRLITIDNKINTYTQLVVLNFARVLASNPKTPGYLYHMASEWKHQVIFIWLQIRKHRYRPKPVIVQNPKSKIQKHRLESQLPDTVLSQLPDTVLSQLPDTILKYAPDQGLGGGYYTYTTLPLPFASLQPFAQPTMVQFLALISASLIAMTYASPLSRGLNSDSIAKWEQACVTAGGAGRCNLLSDSLLSSDGICDQKHTANAMINLAKELGNNQNMIDLTQNFVPKNSLVLTS
ncbi:hypothetical protein BDN72DRAFT_858441 [Pluteus cervinus]|uniref:Uncharacterized protein n=1 Tax=Pluteus cervinus TaxID=181527 RepID=A0ACD3ARL6_9AGAR|nr:hypothetical protein BDN72DRAFT_858441 [Pluteus cervinus]